MNNCNMKIAFHIPVKIIRVKPGVIERFKTYSNRLSMDGLSCNSMKCINVCKNISNI